MHISRYGIADQYTITTHGINPSTIITKMIHLAGRFCEYYASDIVYDAVNFRHAVEHQKQYHRYLLFREGGVESVAPDELEYIEGTDYIQAWSLQYDPVSNTQTFQRIHICKE
jgi:hypothetical protein